MDEALPITAATAPNGGSAAADAHRDRAVLPMAIPRDRWRAHLVGLAGAWIAILALYRHDLMAMADIWWNISTFAHCLFIPAIIGWLIWSRRAPLATLTPAIWLPGAFLIGAGAMGWLLGNAGGISLFRHAGIIVMLQGVTILFLGRNVSQAIAFPIFYLAFMIPVGEELVPAMQVITARMCMVLLDLVGVPAHLEGVFITVSSGYFRVAEACSGVKFLVAMLAYAVLVANVCFLSWPRRIAFVVFALAMSVVANGIRAWGTIYISHLTTIDFAASFDHVVYGWIFFGLVMALVMLAGWKFFDRPIHAPWFDEPRLRTLSEQAPQRPVAAGIALAAAIILAPIGWSAAIAASGRAPLPARIGLPNVPGWHRTGTLQTWPWHARFAGVDHYLQARFANDARPDQVVDLVIALYGHQEEGKEIVGYGQGALDPDSAWDWTDPQPAPANGKAFRITAPGPVIREVAQFYVLGGKVTGNDVDVKWLTLRSRLLGGSQRAMTFIVSAEQKGTTSARSSIDAFVRALGPLDRLADVTAKGTVE